MMVTANWGVIKREGATEDYVSWYGDINLPLTAVFALKEGGDLNDKGTVRVITERGEFTFYKHVLQLVVAKPLEDWV